VVDVLFYFCKRPIAPDSLEEMEQVTKVLKFKKDLNGKSLIWEYDSVNDFKEKIRKHLCLLMNDVVKKKGAADSHKAQPDEEAINTLRALWQRMTPELQNYLSIPYNENRMKGDPGIQTRDLFAAMVTSPSPDLQAVINNIPAAALPAPLEGKTVAEPYIIQEQPWLSHCVSTSIKRLSKALPANQQLSALDVFIDIARNGTGDSVKLLREHNIDPERIEAILKKENLSVLKG
jgi:hypothetical protein